MPFDTTDKKILNILQKSGRITNAKLAEMIGISPPAMLERVRRLEASGIIKEYVTVVDQDKTGFGITAFVTVSLSLHQLQSLDVFSKEIIKLDEVLECYQITGDVDFILKVVIKDINSYTDFVNNKLTQINGIRNVKSSFVLDTIKSGTMLKIDVN